MSDAKPQKDNRLLKGGIAGTLVAAVCCFTPLLVLAFVGAGLSGYIGGIDYVVFPILFASLGVVALALYFRAGRPGPSPRPVIIALVVVFSAGLIWLEFRYAIRITLVAVALVAIYGFYLRSAKAQTAS